MRRRLAALGAALAILALAAPALAITYGQPDGDGHPNVGSLVETVDGRTNGYCSGTLIGPTVLLTAAHCDADRARVSVTFDPEVSARSRLYTGTFHADPAFTDKKTDPHDVAVVVFERAIPDITPAELPTAGQLGDLRVNDK